MTDSKTFYARYKLVLCQLWRLNGEVIEIKPYENSHRKPDLSKAEYVGSFYKFTQLS